MRDNPNNDHRGSGLNRICRQCGKAYTPLCQKCHRQKMPYGLEDNG